MYQERERKKEKERYRYDDRLIYSEECKIFLYKIIKD